MAETFTKSGARAEQRVELAGQILDKLDICRRLIEMHPIDSKLSLARQLLGCAADQIADLAGDEDHERRAIKRAAAPLPVKRRAILDRLDQMAFVAIVGLAGLLAAVWLGASVAIRAGWLSLTAAVVAGPLLVGEALADPQQHRTEAEAFVEGVAERCRDRDAAGMQPFDECVTQADTAIVHALNLAAQMNPDLVRQCHDLWDGDYLLTYICMGHRLRREADQ